MQRKEARALAFELLYEYGFHADESTEDFYEASLALRESKGDDYARRIFFGVTACVPELDALIEANSKNWSMSRMSRVSLSILRLAIFEMRFDDQVETPIAINEAVELSKQYEGQDSYVFINGVLGGVARGSADG